MANHMVEVAKMLGVELGEEFTTDISGIPLYVEFVRSKFDNPELLEVQNEM